MRVLFPYMARWHAVNWTRYHSLLIALADLGHEIVVLQPPSAALQETNFQEIEAVHHPRVKLIDVPIARSLWNKRWPLDKIVKRAAYGAAAIRTARTLLKQEHFDVVLTYNIPQYAFMSLNVPVRVFDYADDYVSMLAKELGPLDVPPLRWLAGRLLDSMMTKAHLSTSVSTELARISPHKVEVLPNGVSFAKAEAARKIPAPATKAGAKKIIGYIGAFEYFIDWQCMIKTAVLMPDHHFLLVGSGREWQAARDLAQSLGCTNVEFTGGVPHEKVFSYISVMDVCLNLFHPIDVSHRACPIKLFEYLSFAKPVISTPLDELRHVDQNFLYYASTPEEVRTRVAEILSSPIAAQEKGGRGREIVRTSYEWCAIAKRFESLVQSRLVAA